MSTLEDIVAEQQALQRNMDDPLLAAVVAELLRQAEEVCVLRDRLDSVERLLEAGSAPIPDAIDAYVPSPELVSERLERHRRYFAELFERVQTVSGPSS